MVFGLGIFLGLPKRYYIGGSEHGLGMPEFKAWDFMIQVCRSSGFGLSAGTGGRSRLSRVCMGFSASWGA